MGRTSSTSPGMEDDDPPAGGGGGGVYDNNNCKMPGVGFISSLADEQKPSDAAAVVNKLASLSSSTTTRLNNNNKLSAETSCFFIDGKVEIRRSPIVLLGDSNQYVSSTATTTARDLNLKQCVSDTDCHLSRCVVTRSNSTTAIIISRHGETRHEDQEEVVVVVEEKDAAADSNNNNDHAPPPDHHHGGGGGGGGGGERRRRSAVEILRRSLVSVTKSPSLNLNNNNRLQQQQRNGSNADGNSNDRGPNRARSDTRIHAGDRQRDECGDCEKKKKTTKSRPEVTAAAEEEEEEAGPGSTPAPSDSHRVDLSPECFRTGDGTTLTSSTDGSLREHVYCTVYCIVDNAEIAKIADPLGRRSVLVAGDERGGEELETAQGEEEEEYTTTTGGGGSIPEPYTLDDLVDPLSGEEGGVGVAVRSCRVCLDDKAISPLHCCRKAVCGECLKLYVSSQVRVGRAYITCPIPECFGLLEEGLVVSHLANEEVGKYRYFLELSRLDASTKPCPHCSLFTSLTPHTPPSTKETKYKIRCSACQFVWCFKCHAPWHDGLKCRDYRRGDKLLRHWASVVEHGQRNAQKCPQCKIHIQRTEGCDHMTCTQCNTNFCYRCGERYRHLRFFGDHTSNLSVFGCKYRYLPDKPHLRRLVRGSVCVSKLVIAPVVIVLVVVLGALSLVIGLLVFPVYYVCKRRRKQQQSQGSGRWI